MTQFGYHFLQEGFSVPQAWPSTTPPVFVAFSFAVVHHLIMSDSLWPHELQHARLPCPLLPPGVCWNSYPLNQWCHPTVSSSVAPSSCCPQSYPASVFSSESALCIRWPKYWSFSFSISLSNENSGLISFRIDWFDLLSVQETLMSLLQP